MKKFLPFEDYIYIYDDRFSIIEICRSVKIFQLGTALGSSHKFHFTLFISISYHLLYKMKSSSTTATGTSAINIASVTSKVAALAFCLFSLFGFVDSNSYVSLYKYVNKFREYSRARIYSL